MAALLILASENWKSLLYGNGSIFRLGGMIVLVIWSSPSLVCLSKEGHMIHIQAIVIVIAIVIGTTLPASMFTFHYL